MRNGLSFAFSNDQPRCASARCSTVMPGRRWMPHCLRMATCCSSVGGDDFGVGRSADRDDEGGLARDSVFPSVAVESRPNSLRSHFMTTGYKSVVRFGPPLM